MKNKLERKIENALMKRFPGLKASVTIDKDGSWDYRALPGSPERFDELYPGMTREQADAQILVDIKAIFKQFMPDTDFIGYERYGKYNRF